MKKILLTLPLLLGGSFTVQAHPQDADSVATEEGAAQLTPGGGFTSASRDLRVQLDESLAELTRLREEMAADKIPMSRRLSELNAELLALKAQFQQTTRTLDSRTLDLSNLNTELQQRRDEASYLSSLLGEYIRGFESGLHIAELQRYEADLETAQLAMENRGLSEAAIFDAQVALLDTSIDRLFEALGGTLFEGTAVDRDGVVERGTFALVGPAALFRTAGSGASGTAEQRLGSLEPAMISFGSEADSEAAASLITEGQGFYPLDPTLGNAHKMEATNETLLEHVSNGGPVMIPIFAMALAALLVALYKWLSFAFLRRPSKRQVAALMAAVRERDVPAAQERAAGLKGPVGKMLAAGVAHIQEPRQLIEEVMYETVLTTRLKLQSLLPFIAICAASAPLLGLLGTVTGIINTFKLITVFGSGDVKSLSGGISEALITTKFGLIVAIPSLLLHAFLARKAKGLINEMEKAAIVFVNHVARSHPKSWREDEPEAPARVSADSHGAPEGQPEEEHLRAQVKQVLGELLSPLTDEGQTPKLAASPTARSDA